MDALSFTPVTATPVASTGAAFPEGAGRVERRLGPDTFVIAIGKEQVTVRVDQGDGGELREGMQVIVRRQNGTVVIEPVGDGRTDPAVPVRADRFSLNATISQALDAASTAISAPSPDGADYQRTAAILNAAMPQLPPAAREITEKIVRLIEQRLAGDPSRLGPDLADEVRSLLARLRDSADESGLPIGLFTVDPAKSLGNALLSFPDADAARKILGIGVGADASALPAGSAQESCEAGPIFLRSTSRPDGSASVRLLLPNELRAEVETLRRNFGSELFRSLPEEVFDRALADIGKLDGDLLQEVDRLASQLRLPAQDMTEEQAPALAHWLRTVLEAGAASPERAPNSQLVARAPLATGPSLPDLIGDLARQISGDPGLPSLETIFPNAAELPGPDDQAGFLQLFFDKIGLGLEHSLLGGDKVDFADLKSRLLQLAHSGAVQPEGRQESSADAVVQSRRQIESALAKIESLQLLARPLPIQGGQEQILSIPVRLDNEWVPLQVRFVKRRQSGRRSGKGRSFGVHLSLAPSGLGGIAAHLDYSPGKAVSIAISFERAGALNWFRQRLPEFRASLQGAGIPSPQISLSAMRRSKARGRAAQAAKSTIVDVTV